MNALAFNDPYKPGAALARSLRSGQATVNHLDAGIHRGRPSRLLCHHPTGSLQPASPGSAHPGEVERWLPVSQQLALDSAKVDRVVGNPDREPELRFHPRGQARVTRLGERIVGKWPGRAGLRATADNPRRVRSSAASDQRSVEEPVIPVPKCWWISRPARLRSALPTYSGRPSGGRPSPNCCQVAAPP